MTMVVEKRLLVPRSMRKLYRILRLFGGLSVDILPSPDGRLVFRKSTFLLIWSFVANTVTVMIPLITCWSLTYWRGFDMKQLE